MIINSVIKASSAPAPTSGYEVTFINPDGEVLKEELVVSGGDATPPTAPNYLGLSFIEWSNVYTNVERDLVVGAVYKPSDNKTHAHISITTASGLFVRLYFNKSNTSTLTVDWGDGNSNTFTNSGNFNTGDHPYASIGDYEITIWISSGSGTYTFGNGSSSTSFMYRSADGNNSPFLRHLFIGSNVTTLGDYAIYKYKSLETITIPPGVTSIGTYVFRFDTALKTAVIPSTVTSIGSYSFASNGDGSLAYATLPDSLTVLGNSLFGYAKLKKLSLPNSLTTIEYAALNSLLHISKITIPASVTSWVSSLYGARLLESVNILCNLSSVPDGCLFNCSQIETITLPTNLTSVPISFANSAGLLSDVRLPAGVTSIGSSAFLNCHSLDTMVIPSGVTTIGDSAFWNCTRMRTYSFEPTTPPTIAANTFVGISPICKIFVPDDSVTDYKVATNWVTWADYIYPLSEA